MHRRRFALAFGISVLLAGAILGCSFIEPSPTPTRAIDGLPANADPIDLKQSAGLAPLTVTRIAHATVLLDFGGLRVLTDPWFTEKAHFHQGEPLGIALKDLPPLDLIVASHEHYDHFDMAAMAAYPRKNVPFLVGPNMVEQARAAGFTQVRELTPWETWRGGEFTVTGVPARHKVPELTFVIQAKGRTVYFGGDTLFIPELRELPARFPSIDLALLSVNGLSVFGEPVVMSAEEAAELAGVMKAGVAVPIHYRFIGSWFGSTTRPAGASPSPICEIVDSASRRSRGYWTTWNCPRSIAPSDGGPAPHLPNTAARCPDRRGRARTRQLRPEGFEIGRVVTRMWRPRTERPLAKSSKMPMS